MNEQDMTESEKKILREIRKELGPYQSHPYMFWFTFDAWGKMTWEGGFELSLDQQFRNQYTIPGPHKQVVKNW